MFFFVICCDIFLGCLKNKLVDDMGMVMVAWYDMAMVATLEDMGLITDANATARIEMRKRTW